MSNKKIDFFSSPQPRAFDVVKYHPEAEDHENLFNTPAADRTHQSPISIDPFFTGSYKKVARKLSGELIFGPESCSPQHEERQHEDALQRLEGINERLDYSDEEQQEDLLLPITPKKAEKILERIEEEEDPTIKKQPMLQSTPATESRCYQRGLKKLAFQAFKFVSSQRKTTYKQVARRLIKQLHDDQQLDSHKKGELNVKRRVYDALNVLIALGLLKRSGNKLIGKKCDGESLFSDRYMEQEKTTAKIEMSCKKEELLLEELKTLKQSYHQRLDAVREKQRLQREVRSKLDSIKYLSERNKYYRTENPQREAVKRRIEMPFILICRQQSSSPFKEEASPSKVLLIEQESNYTLNTSFRSDSAIDFIGDLDIITNMEIQDYTAEEVERRERPEKRKKAK